MINYIDYIDYIDYTDYTNYVVMLILVYINVYQYIDIKVPVHKAQSDECLAVNLGPLCIRLSVCLWLMVEMFMV